MKQHLSKNFTNEGFIQLVDNHHMYQTRGGKPYSYITDLKPWMRTQRIEFLSGQKEVLTHQYPHYSSIPGSKKSNHNLKTTSTKSGDLMCTRWTTHTKIRYRSQTNCFLTRDETYWAFFGESRKKQTKSDQKNNQK